MIYFYIKITAMIVGDSMLDSTQTFFFFFKESPQILANKTIFCLQLTWIYSLEWFPKYIWYFCCKFCRNMHFRKCVLLLSCFSRVRLCATPQTAAHQAPPSLGFSRQEHWSGLPFPSPVDESEKWKAPHRLQPTRLVHPWDFPGESIGVGCHCLLR